MRQKNAVNLTERRDGDAVEDVVTVVEQHLGDADQRGVEFVAAEQFGQLGWRGEKKFARQVARQRRGVQKRHRAYAEFFVCVTSHAGHLASRSILSRWSVLPSALARSAIA